MLKTEAEVNRDNIVPELLEQLCIRSFFIMCHSCRFLVLSETSGFFLSHPEYCHVVALLL